MREAQLAGLTVLIVEDEPLLRQQLAALLEELGAEVTQAETVEAARRLSRELGFDLVLLDINLPDGKGTLLLQERAFGEHAAVVVMTAEGNIPGAVEAMRLGAVDYLAKPFDAEELPLVLWRARQARQKTRLAEHRRQPVSDESFYFGQALAGVRQTLEKIVKADHRVTGTPPPVLILGETGTGKTSIARWLHANGPRAGQPLVEINCSALPASLAESELFGHERGAFTDARQARMGLFEAASGGTLFLDELPSLSPPLQAKVLTAIEDGVVRRLGGNRTIHVDTRIIAAAGPDLRDRVARGEFREDLFHRLDLFRIELPPLRDRGEDILDLAEKLLEQACRKHRLPLRRISPRGRRRLLAYRWPGNVRELAHEIERAIVFSEEEALDFESLPVAMEELAEPLPSSARPDGGVDWLNPHFRFPEKGFSLEAAVHRLIQKALEQTSGNVSAAARMLGVSRDYLRYRLSGRKSSKDERQAPEHSS